LVSLNNQNEERMPLVTVEYPHGLLSASQKATLADPLMEYPKAYFEAKRKLYAAHQFPALTSGKPLADYAKTE
jgi:hypothetical protein